jgi:hypothetical protein
MQRKYAQGTEVSTSKSKFELETLLEKYGANQILFGNDPGRAALVAFICRGKQIRFILPFPAPNSDDFRRTATGRIRKNTTRNEAYDEEIKRLWRSLSLCVKGKLEAVEAGIVTFEQEFLPYFVLPGGQTVSERIMPEIEQMCLTGNVPKLLPDFSGKMKEK